MMKQMTNKIPIHFRSALRCKHQLSWYRNNMAAHDLSPSQLPSLLKCVSESILGRIRQCSNVRLGLQSVWHLRWMTGHGMSNFGTVSKKIIDGHDVANRKRMVCSGQLLSYRKHDERSSYMLPNILFSIFHFLNINHINIYHVNVQTQELQYQ